MKLPIFVIDDSDVDIFFDEKALSSYIEAYDVADNTAFDATGLKLTLKVINDPIPMVVVEEPCGVEYSPDILSERIKIYLHAIDNNIDVTGLNLEDLVDISIKRIGYS